MCCSGPAWKREVVQDHKFDFIDTRDYHTKNFGVRVQYLWVYILVLKSFLVYISDIYTAVTMLSSETWTNNIYMKCDPKDCPVNVSFKIGKWIFVGCIIFSFLLLAYEARKAKRIIASRDISSAFTNVMANNYYSLRSYDHFCFFCQIENSTKKKDDFAFFIFFTFKEWKRLLLADGPRQTINTITLYSYWIANGRGNPFEKLSVYYNGKDYLTAILLVAMVFTVVVFLGSLLLLIIAGILYVPLLCYIRGNLKEYCCHKVDKRIAELIKKKTHQRVQLQAKLARKEAAGDFSHLKNKNGEAVTALPQPTLPSVSVDDDEEFDASSRKQPYPSYQLYDTPVGGGQHNQYWSDSKSAYGAQSDYAPSTYAGTTAGDQHDYPPMPGYNNGYQSHPQYPQQQFNEYVDYSNPKVADSIYSYNMGDESQTHLPYARGRQGSVGAESALGGAAAAGTGGTTQANAPSGQDYPSDDGLPGYNTLSRTGAYDDGYGNYYNYNAQVPPQQQSYNGSNQQHQDHHNHDQKGPAPGGVGYAM